MNKKLLFVPFLMFSVLFFSGCGVKSVEVKTSATKELKVNDNKPKADKVQVFLFHATKRCATCIAIGELSSKTVYEYFQPELQAGKIESREINIDLPENKELAKKFQASGSALFINAIYDGQDHITEDTRVWRLTKDDVQFKNYLREKINSLLGK